MDWFEKYFFDFNTEETDTFWSEFNEQIGYDPVFGIQKTDVTGLPKGAIDNLDYLDHFVSDAGIRSGIYESPTDAQYESFLGYDPYGYDPVYDETEGDVDIYREPSAAAKTRDLFGIGAKGAEVLKRMGAQRLSNKAGGDRFGNTRIKRGGLPTGSSGGVSQVASLQARKAQDAARLAAGSGSSYLSKAMESFYKGNRVTNNSIASLFQEYLSATGSSGGKAGVTTALNPALRQIAIKRTA